MLPLLPALVLLALPPVLEQWRAEIEAAGGAPVLVAEVEFSADGSEMRLPDDVPGRPLFVQYLRREDFVRQFLLMRGVLVHHQGPDANAFLVLLNGARRGEWGAHEASLLGHEFGHAWLRARGYPAPVFPPGPLACLAIHTGDIVQHVLIRREMDRRGIPHQPLWLESLAAATRAARTWPDGDGLRRARVDDPCLAARQAAEWADVRLGFIDARPEVVDQYEAEMRRVYPGLESVVGSIAEAVSGLEVEDRQRHREALELVFAHLRNLPRSIAGAH